MEYVFLLHVCEFIFLILRKQIHLIQAILTPALPLFLFSQSVIHSFIFILLFSFSSEFGDFCIGFRVLFIYKNDIIFFSVAVDFFEWYFTHLHREKENECEMSIRSKFFMIYIIQYTVYICDRTANSGFVCLFSFRICAYFIFVHVT